MNNIANCGVVGPLPTVGSGQKQKQSNCRASRFCCRFGASDTATSRRRGGHDQLCVCGLGPDAEHDPVMNQHAVPGRKIAHSSSSPSSEVAHLDHGACCCTVRGAAELGPTSLPPQ